MLITILVVLIILGLALYATQLIPIDDRLTLLIQLLLIVIAIIYIARAAGIG
jgi:hypothetical protein